MWGFYKKSIARFHELYDPFAKRHGLVITQLRDRVRGIPRFALGNDSTRLIFDWGWDYHGGGKIIWLSLSLNVKWIDDELHSEEWTCSIGRLLSLWSGEFQPLVALDPMKDEREVFPGLELLLERVTELHPVIFSKSQNDLKLLWRRWLSQNCSHLPLQESFIEKAKRHFQFLETDYDFEIEDVKINDYPTPMTDAYAAEYHVRRPPCSITYRKLKVLIRTEMICDGVPIVVNIANENPFNIAAILRRSALAKQLHDERWQSGHQDKIILPTDLDPLLSAYAEDVQNLAPTLAKGKLPRSKRMNDLLKQNCPESHNG